jgi:hypothetical protein
MAELDFSYTGKKHALKKCKKKWRGFEVAVLNQADEPNSIFPGSETAAYGGCYF